MMRRRSSILSVLGVIASFGTLVTTVGYPAVAHAQAPEDEVTRLAREQFLDGVKAYDAGQYTKARLHFLQAYALTRHPAVLLNLGQSELKTGDIEAAGNHLQQFLREHQEATEAQKTAAREGIEEAQRRTGFVVIVVDQNGASISIDGRTVGTAPLLGPYFIKPGPHQAAATKNGKVAKGSFVAERAQPATITLNLGGGGAPAPAPAPVPSPPSPLPGPAPAPMPGAYPTPMPPYPQPGIMPYPQPGGGYDPGPDTAESDDPITWFENRPVAWVTVGVFGAGVVGMVVAGAIAGDAASAANSTQDQILAEANSRGLAGRPCGPIESSGSSDTAGFANACNQLRDNLDTHDSAIVAVGALGAVAAVGLGATLIYYFVDTADSGGSAIVVTPSVGLERQGLSVRGSF